MSVIERIFLFASLAAILVGGGHKFGVLEAIVLSNKHAVDEAVTLERGVSRSNAEAHAKFGREIERAGAEIRALQRYHNRTPLSDRTGG